MIRNFIWEDKQGSILRQVVLQLEYDKGGLHLVDITCKIKVQRLKRIMYLLSIEDEYSIERFLADSLVGNYLGQQGLSYGLISHINRIKMIQNDFYRYALEIANSLNIMMKPGKINTILKEPLFYNTLIMDTNNRVFTLSRLKNQMPKTVKEIQNFPFSREPVVNETVRNLKIAINNIDIANKEWNEFNVRIGNDLIDINKAEFKDIYLMFLGKKTEIREWETRMNNYLQTPGTNWEKVWQNSTIKLT
jgi:hypothetical protein